MSDNYDILIEYINEIKCKITTKREILYDLRNKYSFYANGYKFSPKYKQGIWDGKIYMIDTKGMFYNGLIKDLLIYTKECNLKVKLTDIDKFRPTTTPDETIQKLREYVTFEPYDYQLRSVKEALNKRKLLILSPTSCLDGDTEIEVFIVPKKDIK